MNITKIVNKRIGSSSLFLISGIVFIIVFLNFSCVSLPPLPESARDVKIVYANQAATLELFKDYKPVGKVEKIIVHFVDPHAIQRRAAELKADIAQIIYLEGSLNYVRFWSSIPGNGEAIE